MVPPEHVEPIRILDFVAEEEGDRLYALFSSVDVVAEEEVVRLRRIPSVFE